jgi:hypothetical protein
LKPSIVLNFAAYPGHIVLARFLTIDKLLIVRT